MAIQMRRGDYADFDPTKMVAGELAVVTSGDPNSDTGRSLYVCFEPGVVKRVTDYEDLIDQVNAATQEIQQRFTSSVEQSARNAASSAASASSSAGTASSASESATAASQSASSAQAAAESAAAAAKGAKEYVDQHGTKPMTGATTTATGTAGTVPAPQAGTSTRFLCSDATWKEAVDATQGKAINDAIAKNAADIATNKSGISKNKADITALNGSLSKRFTLLYSLEAIQDGARSLSIDLSPYKMVLIVCKRQDNGADLVSFVIPVSIWGNVEVSHRIECDGYYRIVTISTTSIKWGTANGDYPTAFIVPIKIYGL
ncbi:hypothetical protein [Porcincola intestinalis]|uniref:Tail fiber protein n=1 Tax=Porcincola intestinalis TaxID=2606632 RepID=A0A6L5X2R1_9FIRM|nr:hypothetical protein [Porcincola intestinalis]MSS13777.1 hypothetical protein [Porcincola intestinalis]